jgi:hypothetical protein
MNFNKPKSFEEAASRLGYSTELPDVSKLPARHAQAVIDHYKAIIIIEDINAKWVADYLDRNQRKWVLWPDIVKDDTKPSGLGLAYGVFGDGDSNSFVGSRLSFCCVEAARYFFDNFSHLMESYFLYLNQ